MTKLNTNYFLRKHFLLFGKYAEEAVGIFLLLPVRIRMKIHAKRKARLANELVRNYKNPEVPLHSNLWNLDAVLPGNPELLPSKMPSIWIIPSMEASFNELLEHKIAVLSSQKFDINRSSATLFKNKIKEIVPGIDPGKVDSYKPIDWHKDFKSGYRWNDGTFYLDIRVAPVAGADIKVPRELSRFQHVGLLARGPLNLGAEEFILQVADWITANPYGYGVNWACTMDVALRAVNWIWGMRFFETELVKHPETIKVLTTSLHQHAVYIERNLEYYKGSTGNHYLSDICGLLYIGCAFPEFKEADRWVLFGMQEFMSELSREVYNDGGAHEASTHYHRLVAELFTSGAALCERMSTQRRKRLLLVNSNDHGVEPPLQESVKTRLNLGDVGRIFPHEFYQRLSAIGYFSKSLTKPNNHVPQFGDNDSARVHKIFPSPEDHISDHRHIILAIELLCGSAGNAEIESKSLEASLLCGNISAKETPILELDIAKSSIFPDTGIAVLRNEHAFLAVSCGTNGQIGRGGHGHNDKLSFELNINGLDYIIDGGCPVYTADPAMRNKFRSTAAHSTIHIIGREQDEWANTLDGLFVLRERSFPKLKLKGNRIEGSHFGYDVPHHRNFILEARYLKIQDYFPTAQERIMVFNFHPDVFCSVVSFEASLVKVELNHSSGRKMFLEIDGVVNPKIGCGYFSNGYGVPIDTQNLTLELTMDSATTTIDWRD